MTSDYDAFLSHSRKDVEWVRALHKNLEAFGLRVFRDESHISPGRQWPTELERALVASTAIVLVVTPAAMASTWVSRELQVAEKNGLVVYPLVLRDAPLPEFQGIRQHIDLRDARDDYAERLFQLATELGASRQTRPELLPEPPVRRHLPQAIRAELLNLVTPLFECRLRRRGLATLLEAQGRAYDLLQPTSDRLAANAFLSEWPTVGGNPATTALDILDVLEAEGAIDKSSSTALRTSLQKPAKEWQLSPSHESYLKLVRRDHNKLLGSLFDNQTREIHEIYVDLELDAQSALREATPNTNGLELQRLLSLGEGLRFVLLGGPGTGKTTMLRHYARTLADDSSIGWVPLYLSLPEWIREPTDAIESVASRFKSDSEKRGVREFLAMLRDDGRLLLMLDGFDEVPNESRTAVKQAIRDLSQEWKGAPILVASRPIGYEKLDDFELARLRTLSKGQKLEFLEQWLKRDHGDEARRIAERELEPLLADPWTRELSDRPLDLTLIAMMIERGEEVPKLRHLLFERFLDRLVRHDYRIGPKPVRRPDDVRDILGAIAYEMTDLGRLSMTRRELIAIIEDRLDREPYKHVAKVDDWKEDAGRFLDEVADCTSILAAHRDDDEPRADDPFESREPEWRFWHKSFREALCAERLWKSWAKPLLGRGQGVAAGMAEWLDQLQGNEDRWAEAFAMLSGWLPDDRADEWVVALAKKNEALGMTALATMRRPSEATFEAVLTLGDDPSARAKAYEQLTSRFGGNEEHQCHLRELLVRLAKLERTESGFDLYFLDQAMRELGKRAGWSEGETERECARLYPAMDDAAAALFAHVPGKKDEPFWREIPDTGGTRFSATTITFAQYRRFSPKHDHGWGDGVRLPATRVSWYEAVAFCRWLGQRFPGARLPTEKEWEHACRAGTKHDYWSGKGKRALKRVGWYEDNSEGRVHGVAELEKNPWGLYDVHGNVWEWCEDEPESGDRALRGGSYYDDAFSCLASNRDGDGPGGRVVNIGFRVVWPSLADSTLGT